MATDLHVMGLFRDESQAVAAMKSLLKSPWKLVRVHGPFPSHRIHEALKLKKSRVGLFTLTGGIIGFFTGIGLATFTATRWHLIVSGKPIVALVPFLIVGFEFTILFSVLGNIVGLLTQARLPEFKSLELYDPRCSGEHFGILASCGEAEVEGLKDFFRKNGGEIGSFG
jgi:molybdopterin-containing oxidoreductase family membrane subunit